MMCLVKTSYDQIKYIGRKKGLNKSRSPCYKKKLIEIKVDAYDISRSQIDIACKNFQLRNNIVSKC